jgi:hypothetical protein
VTQPTRIYTRTVNDNGTFSNFHGPVSLANINAKRVYGGCAKTPASFVTLYGFLPFMCGWGGYTSLVAQGGGASMGLNAYAIPDISGYANNATIPGGSFQILADHVQGTFVGDWYSTGGQAPTVGDRGARVTLPTNYFDGGDPRQNPPTRPTVPPAAGAQWLSPTPNGSGRWTWGDSYYNTGNWIDGTNKYGFITVASLCGGFCWYQSSTLAFDFRQFELHIFDPAQMAQVVAGTRQPWNIQPSGMVALSLLDLGLKPGCVGGDMGNGAIYNVAGAVYDPVVKRLYIEGISMCTNVFINRLYVYAVNDN